MIPVKEQNGEIEKHDITRDELSLKAEELLNAFSRDYCKAINNGDIDSLYKYLDKNDNLYTSLKSNIEHYINDAGLEKMEFKSAGISNIDFDSKSNIANVEALLSFKVDTKTGIKNKVYQVRNIYTCKYDNEIGRLSISGYPVG